MGLETNVREKGKAEATLLANCEWSVWQKSRVGGAREARS